MLSKNQQKFISSLSVKKYREQEGCFVVEGVKPVEELLLSAVRVRSVFAVNSWLDNNRVKQLNRQGIVWQEVSEVELAKVSGLKTPNQVLAVAEIPQREAPDLKSGFFILLDRINDPGNLGTIIRIADWFGIKAVICSPETTDCYNSKVVQSAMGSLFRMPVIYDSLEKIVSKAHQNNVPVYLADMNGTPLQQVKFGSNGLIVMGSESHGVAKELIQAKNQQITIPGIGAAESLNVGVAAGIICSRIRG